MVIRIISAMILLFYSLSSFATPSLTKDSIIQYLSKIDSVAIEFRQKQQDDDFVGGQFIIKKPYNFRCNYYKPYPLLIVGNKNYISLYDFEMQQLSRIKSNKMLQSENNNILISFLLSQPHKFKKLFHIEIDKITKSNYEVILTSNLYRNQKIRLYLSIKPLLLTRLEVINLDSVDQRNGNIILDITSIRNIKNISPQLFSIKSLAIADEHPEQLGKKELEKKYKLID